VIIRWLNSTLFNVKIIWNALSRTLCVWEALQPIVCVCCYQLKLWRGSLLKLMRSLMKGLQGHSKPLSLQPPLISALPLFKLPHPPTVGTCTCGSLHHHPISHPPTLHTHTHTHTHTNTQGVYRLNVPTRLQVCDRPKVCLWCIPAQVRPCQAFCVSLFTACYKYPCYQWK